VSEENRENDNEDGIFIAVMDLQEAKTHQIRLKEKGVALVLKTHRETCTTGCKVTVEVWGENHKDEQVLREYFSGHFMNNVKGHVPNFEHLAQVFDPSADEVICQACGMKFSPKLGECPDCGLVYS
jgi:hypothetical protein